MRKSFVMLGFAALLPLQSVTADQLNTYHNEELRYTLSFQDSWVRFSEEMLNTLAPEERENAAAIFLNPEDSTQLFIRHLPTTSKQYYLFNDLVTYVKETPEERQKIEKKLNPISTEIGRRIEGYYVDVETQTVVLHFHQTSGTFGEIRTTVCWSLNGDTLIELEFYNLQNNPLYKEKVNTVLNSFTYSGDTNTTVQEGSLINLENIWISEHIPPLQKLLDFLDRPGIWYGSGLAIAVIMGAYIFYRII